MNSIAIFHKKKNLYGYSYKRTQAEAKIADKFISDIECKFEFMLFNDDYKGSYNDLYLYFKSEWNRYIEVLKKRNFQFIIINKNHFDNLYKPILNL